jgi:8-oxo-dGTP diphosphatase
MSDQQILQRVAAKAAIVNSEGKVLILREASTYDEGTNIGRYGLPGGRVTPGEHFFDGLKREILEETGLEVKIGKPVYVDEWFPIIKGTPNHIVGMFFECKPLSDNVKLSEEHDDYRWISAAEIDDYEMIATESAAIRAWEKM